MDPQVLNLCGVHAHGIMHIGHPERAVMIALLVEDPNAYYTAARTVHDAAKE